MRSLILVVAISALAWARPETYKETEDFKFARSSSDEGSKSGYYAAQRGNVAGNYERAHNMDGLAQHQMSTAVRQVEGELGDAAKTPSGNVYTAANSRGIYGSGYYDNSNLHGRNFDESSSADSSHSSLSSAYNQRSQNSDWRTQSQRAGYGASSQLGQSSLHTGSLHAADDTSAYGTSHLGSHSHSNGYHSASGYHSQLGYYDQSQLDESGSSGAQAGDQSRRYTIVAPVRIVGRPGTQIAIPVYGQAGYASQSASSLFDQKSSSTQTHAQQSAASRFDQNAIDSEAEVLNNNQQHVSSVPISNGKHYSSSYNYQKAWERHSETTDLPVRVPNVPTEIPLPKNSELYEDLRQIHAKNSHSGTAYTSANAYNQAHSAHSASSQASHESDYRSQHGYQDAATSNAYTQGVHGGHTGLSTLVDSQPKSYQSSYSYHKAWERQGDPYVIEPATNGDASQRLTSGNTKTSASSQRYGSHQQYSQGSSVDCNSLCRYRRATRSAGTQDYYQQDQENLGQQAQTGWEENLGQQIQEQYRPAKLEDLGQQAQQLQDLGQQTQTRGNIEYQQRPQKLEDLGQQTQQSWGNLEDLGQQQQSWDNIQQQRRPQKLEDLGQHTQQSWGDLQQQQRPQKLEHLGQQTQGKWQSDRESDLENLGQQTQQSWDKTNTEPQSNNKQLEDLGQQTQSQWETNNQQSQQTFENLDNPGQQTQTKWNYLENLGQHTQHSWNGSGNIGQENENLGQQTQNKWDDLENLGQQVQNQWHNINTINKTRYTDTINTEQQTLTHFGKMNPNREQAGENIPYSFNKDNSDSNNPDHPAFWGLTNEQKHESNYYNHQHNSYYNRNSYSNSQNHGTSWRQEVNDNNAQTMHNNPLQSLWDKLDNMEEQSEHKTDEYQQHTEYENSQHSYGRESTPQNDINWDRSNGSYYRETYNTASIQPPIVFNTVDKPKNDRPHNVSVPEKPNDDDLIEEPEPEEVGRGDIGADHSATTPKLVTDSYTYTTHIKPDKTPEEIEALSLSRGTEEDANSLSVLSINQQKSLEEQRQNDTYDLHQISTSSSSTLSSLPMSENVINRNTTPKDERHTVQSSISQQSDKTDNSDYNLQQKTTPNQLDESRKQTQDLNQLHQPTSRQHNFDHQSTEKQLEDFGQQTQDLSQQSLEHFTNLGLHSHNIDQHNLGQQLEDFGQQMQDLNQEALQSFTNIEQHSHKFDQQNTGKQLEDFGQQNQDLSQQNLQPFANSEHSHNFDQQNTGQQLVDFEQQNHDQQGQQNLQSFPNLGQHSQSFDQQNTGQQLEDFGQQSQNYNQHNLHQLTNLGQHNQNPDQENKRQQLDDFGQKIQDLNQQTLQSSWSPNLNQNQAREFVPNSNTQMIQEAKVTPVNVQGSEIQPKKEVEIIPPSVTTTEKPGFWKSVGGKLSSAKDSVASWFKRS